MDDVMLNGGSSFSHFLRATFENFQLLHYDFSTVKFSIIKRLNAINIRVSTYMLITTSGHKYLQVHD